MSARNQITRRGQFRLISLFVLTVGAAVLLAILRLPIPIIARLAVICCICIAFRIWNVWNASSISPAWIAVIDAVGLFTVVAILTLGRPRGVTLRFTPLEMIAGGSLLFIGCGHLIPRITRAVVKSIFRNQLP